MLKKKKKPKSSTTPTVNFVSETINLPRIVLSDDDEIITNDKYNIDDDNDDNIDNHLIDENNLHISFSQNKYEPEDISSDTDTDTLLWMNNKQIFYSSNTKPSELIKINVGGSIFCTTRTTLTNHGGMLAAMFSGRYSPLVDENNCYFIDRDGTYFRYILNYLRDGFVKLPESLQVLQELMIEAQFYQIEGLIKDICAAPRLSKNEYITIRYLPANTYDGWPIRIEGPLEEYIIVELNGGSLPPNREIPEVRNMYGQSSTGWKVRGIFLTKIFNIIASYGWRLTTSNGSGGGKQRNFAEMYVFCRSKSLRRQKAKNTKRRSATYSYSHLFPYPPKVHREDNINLEKININEETKQETDELSNTHII